MRARSAVLALLLLSSTIAYADSIDRISPQSIFAFNPEQFIRIFGSGLAGTQSTVVTYTSEAGQFSVDASNATSTVLDVWVPVGVTNVPGRYAVDVYATDATGVRHIGPAFLDVLIQQVEAPPLLGVPEILIATATSTSGAAVTFNVTAESQGGTGLTVGCDHTSGSIFPIGTTNVTCTATDSFGTAIAGFLVVVSDYGVPTLNLPADIVSDDPVVTYTVTATDTIDPSPKVVCTPVSGATFPAGTTTVTCIAEDHSANFAIGTFRITITGGLPQLILPDDITVEATSPTGTPVTFTVTATDGAVQCTPESGSLFPLGTTTVNCTATNGTGSTNGSFTVTVVDTTPPEIISVTANPPTLWPPDHKMIGVTVTAVVMDNGDPNPLVHIVSVSSDQPVDGTGDGDTAPDWEITGPTTVNLRAERAHNADRTYTITIEVSDASGNVSQATVTVKVTQGKRRAG
ncbi:MAG TPA: HYR domain-containing protein [Thermoanaerobaculia bacterium]